MTNLESRITDSPSRQQNERKDMTHVQPDGETGIRLIEFRCPGAGFSLWRILPHGDRVAAVARARAGFSAWRKETPIRDTDLNFAAKLGLAIPTCWWPETFWTKIIR